MEGVKLAENYLKQFPSNGAIRLELISSTGLEAEQRGIIKNATNGVVDKMKKQAEALIKIDSMHYCGGGWKVLGALYYSVPYIPGILSWPDKKEAVAILSKRLQYFPSHTGRNCY